MKVNKTLLTISFSLMSFAGFSQDDCPMQIGTNIYHADEQSLKDLKMTSSHFCAKNITWMDDGNDWDSELIGVIPIDENGYPTIDVPFNHSSVAVPQVYHFLTATSGIYPVGHYILTFEGDGVLSISDWSDAENVTVINANRIEFDVLTTFESGIHVVIEQSSAANHVRNIRIVHQNDWATYATQPFRQKFIDLLDNFSCIRFMDWMATNSLNYGGYDNSTLSWSDRVTPSYHRHNSEEQGIAYEYVIMLANQTGKDIWINIPHRADSVYIRNMAELFYNNMNSTSTIYVEFSNEVWNTLFQQTEYVQEEGPYSGDLGRNLGWYSDRTFAIWADVFGTERNRLKFVLAGFDFYCVDALSVMSIMPDVASYSGYFHLSDDDWDALEILGTSATVTDITNRAAASMRVPFGSFHWMKEFKRLVCDPHDLDFVMYEGGQHLLRYFGMAETFQDTLYKAQISPEMYDLYMDLLTFCRDTLEVTLFNHFTLYGPNENLFGSWGMVESVYATPNTSKYNALMEFVCDSTGGSGINNVSAQMVNIFPNPAQDNVLIEAKIPIQKIVLYDMYSRKLKEINPESTVAQLYLSSFPAGMYMLEIQTKNGRAARKIIKE